LSEALFLRCEENRPWGAHVKEKVRPFANFFSRAPKA
jgi:hypothetical protein